MIEGVGRKIFYSSVQNWVFYQNENTKSRLFYASQNVILFRAIKIKMQSTNYKNAYKYLRSKWCKCNILKIYFIN